MRYRGARKKGRCFRCGSHLAWRSLQPAPYRWPRPRTQCINLVQCLRRKRERWQGKQSK